MALHEHSISSSLLAVVPAAGLGSRMGLPVNKVFLPISSDGSPGPVHQGGDVQLGGLQVPGEDSILSVTLRGLLSSSLCHGAVLVSRESDLGISQALIDELKTEFPDKLLLLVLGGDTRQESVFHGLLALSEHEPQWVLIHDGARPFLSQELLHNVIQAAKDKGAALLATPARQTLKRSLDGVTVIQTIPRDEMWEAQTPQVFRFQEILRAHKQAAEEQFLGTDDSELYERIGGIVQLVRGDETNFKITSPFDLAVAKVMRQEPKV